MGIFNLFLHFGLGILVGSFGIIQILILMRYSLPTNKVLFENEFASDFKSMNKSDRISIIAVSFIVFSVTILIFILSSRSNSMIYLIAILAPVFSGRKQLKGNDNNVLDYLNSHKRYLVNFNQLSEEDQLKYTNIVYCNYNVLIQGLGGFLLVYIFAVLFYSVRLLYAVINSIELLSNSETIAIMAETNNKIVPFGIVHLIYSLCVSISVVEIITV